MALLAPHRRYFGPVVLVLLVLLMLGALVPDPSNTARPFSLPADKPLMARLAALPDAVSRYVAENFAYSNSLPFLRGVVQYKLGTPSDPRIIIGRHEHLYYNDEHVTGQATGAVYRTAEVGHFVDMAEALDRALAPIGSRLVVLLPPNPQSVATRDLPSWWHVEGPLEYDMALRELGKRGVATVDLKAGLAAMPDANDLYLHTDTHWRRKAAVLAFNMAMQSIGHAEWSVDPAGFLLPLAPAPGGDLAGLLGLKRYLADQDYPLRDAPDETGWTPIDVIRSPPYVRVFFPYAFEQRQDGERILVLGDSFTLSFWRPLLLRTGAARIGWMHHSYCGFDFNDVVRFRPTWVFLAPTERSMPCLLKFWPKDLPRVTARAPVSAAAAR